MAAPAGTRSLSRRDFAREAGADSLAVAGHGAGVGAVGRRLERVAPGGEVVFLLCRSAQRRAKAQAVPERFEKRIEKGLRKDPGQLPEDGTQAAEHGYAGGPAVEAEHASRRAVRGAGEADAGAGDPPGVASERTPGAGAHPSWLVGLRAQEDPGRELPPRRMGRRAAPTLPSPVRDGVVGWGAADPIRDGDPQALHQPAHRAPADPARATRSEAVHGAGIRGDAGQTPPWAR